MRNPIRVRVAMTLALVVALVGLAQPAAATLTEVGAFVVQSGSKAYDVVLAGNHAYVVTDTGHLVILDVATNPLAPIKRSSLLLGGGPANGVAIEGDFAYVATYKALKVVNISNPAAPVLVATRNVPKGFDVAVKRNAAGRAAAYVASFYGEVHVFDVGDPLNPVKTQLLGVLAWREASQDPLNVPKLEALTDSGNGSATGIAVAGDYLVVSEWRYGRIIVWNVASPLQPDFVGTHQVTVVLRAEPDPAGETIYIFSAYGATSGVYTVPITHLVSNVSTRHSTCSVCAYFKSDGRMDMGGIAVSPNGQYVAFAGGKRGEMHLLRVTPGSPSTPPTLTEEAQPFFEGHYVKAPFAMGFAFRGNVMYAAAGLRGLVVYTFSGDFD